MAIEPNSVAIDVKNLCKRYGDRTVVDNFDLKVPKGAIYGFLGPNGSGKTTTIRLMCGLLKADGGSGTCLGLDIRTQSKRIKAKVGYMTQRFSLYEDLSIRENLSFVARMYGVPNVQRAVQSSLDELGLASRAHQYAAELSGGWKQRLALAACLMHKPALLLLDEPTAGVDPQARRDFWNKIRALADHGVTVLVSTHYMDEAVQCDNIAYIAYGRKLIDGPTAEIPDRVGLSTWRVQGDGLRELSETLQHEPAISQVARFGTQLHVSGTNKQQLALTARSYRRQGKHEWSEQTSGLEEIFLHLMAKAEDNFPSTNGQSNAGSDGDRHA